MLLSKHPLRTAVRDWVGLNGGKAKNLGQFNAITGYARQHTYPLSFGVLTLFDGGARDKQSLRAQLIRSALNNKVGVIIGSILQNVNSPSNW